MKTFERCAVMSAAFIVSFAILIFTMTTIWNGLISPWLNLPQMTYPVAGGVIILLSIIGGMFQQKQK